MTATNDIWQPCFSKGDPEYERCSLLLDTLAENYLERHNKLPPEMREALLEQSVSPISGYPSEVLFLIYYALHKNDNAILAHAITELGKIILALRPKGKLSFATGMAGFLWLVYHLKRQSVVELDDSFLAKDCIGPLFHHSMSRLSTGQYDYLAGGLGICLPLLESQEGDCNKHLADIVSGLEKISHKAGDGTYWLYNLEKSKMPYEPVSFGLSHGVTGIVVLLSMICGRGIETKKCSELIKRACVFIESKRLDKVNYPIYPSLYYLRDNLSVTGNRQLGWCYGDLNIAWAFLSASSNNSRDYIDRADAILQHTIHQKASYGVPSDATICHGISGVAHFYHTIANVYPQLNYLSTARNWYRQLFDAISITDRSLLVKQKDIAGNVWTDAPGLISGTAGSGMCLLAAISNVKPAWNKSLLLTC